MATSSANRAVVNCVFDSPAQSLFRCVRSKSGAISKLFSCDFSVMPFSNEDKILIKHYRLDKGYGAKRLLIEFPDKGWTLGGVRTLLEKIDQTGSVDRQEGSGRPRTARTEENINHNWQQLGLRYSWPCSHVFFNFDFQLTITLDPMIEFQHIIHHFVGNLFSFKTMFRTINSNHAFWSYKQKTWVLFFLVHLRLGKPCIYSVQ